MLGVHWETSGLQPRRPNHSRPTPRQSGWATQVQKGTGCVQCLLQERKHYNKLSIPVAALVLRLLSSRRRQFVRYIEREENRCHAERDKIQSCASVHATMGRSIFTFSTGSMFRV